jgi:hypothetical protein
MGFSLGVRLKAADAFKRGRADDWTLERIARLSVQDIKQLRANAERLNEAAVVALCSDALRTAPRAVSRAGTKSTAHKTKARRLIARTRAFEARGVWLVDRRTSWSGLRKSDGAIVMALWADAVESTDGGCSCLLWAPNVDGSRPWSEEPAGRERLEHCKRALEHGGAEGLLVYGERLAGRLPEDKAHAVHGIDPETVVAFQVELRGKEFWAKWGGKATSSIGNG